MANVSRNLPANRAGSDINRNVANGGKPARKGMSPGKAGLMVFLFMVFLLMAATALVYFDVMDARQIMVNVLLEGKSPYDPQIARLEELSLSLSQESLALEQGKAELESARKQLEKKEKTLTSKEETLVSQQTALEENTALAATTEENVAKLVAMYEKMDAARAAKIIEEMYDVDDVSYLLSRMKQDKASGILAAMDTVRAARVTELLMNSQ